MNLCKKHFGRRLALRLGLVGLAFMPLSASAGAPGVNPAVGTPFVVFGGSSAVFNNEVIAVLGSLTAVYNVYQECGTGANVGTSNGCNLPAPVLVGAHSAIQNFVAIHGLTRACGAATPPACYGTPLAHEVVYFISANGSGFGVACSAPPHKTLAVVGIAGLDGIYGDADDPIGVLPAFPVGSVVPAGWPGYGAHMSAVASCPGKTSAAAQLPHVPALIAPPNVGNEYCIVDDDINGDGAIGVAGSATGGQVAGVVPSGVLNSTTIGTNNSPEGASGLGETSNIAEQCAAGFADVPPVDFDPSTGLTGLDMNNQQQIGEQLFKIVVATSLRPQTDNTLFPSITSANKIYLTAAQLQAIFGQQNAGSDACTWHDVGVIDTNAANQPACPNGGICSNMTVCQREAFSGTLATFQNHFTIEKYGFHLLQPSNGKVVAACNSTGEEFTAEPATNKTYVEGFSTSDEVNCVSGTGVGAGTVGQIGYVTATTTSPNFYAPVVEGIDADAYLAQANGPQEIRNLAKCGLWPFVGPSVAGTGIADPTGLAANLITAMSVPGIFDESNSANFISLGDQVSNGIANQKSRVD